MGARDGVAAFAPDDSFLRRIDRKRHALDGIIATDVFKPRPNETTLSFTYQDASLRQEGALAAYQFSKRLRSGDLPGICRLTFHDLTIKLDPPLPPRPEQDEAGSSLWAPALCDRLSRGRDSQGKNGETCHRQPSAAAFCQRKMTALAHVQANIPER